MNDSIFIKLKVLAKSNIFFSTLKKIIPTNVRGFIFKILKNKWFTYNIIQKKINENKLNALIHNLPKSDINLDIFNYKIYSQDNEDGIIHGLNAIFPFRHNFVVELGVGNAKQCNTRYLVEQTGTNYLYIDAADNKKTYLTIQKEFIRTDNINELLQKYIVPKELDLFSIDLDYNTYYILDAISIEYQPSFFLVEYNSSIPYNKKLVVKNDKNRLWDGSNYFGASLMSYVELLKSRGYTLIYCDKNGVNAYYMKDSLLKDHMFLNQANIAQLYREPKYGLKKGNKFIGHLPSEEKFVELE